jgi:hypothetical protein
VFSATIAETGEAVAVKKVGFANSPTLAASAHLLLGFAG